MQNSLKFCILELNAKCLLTPSQHAHSWAVSRETLEMEFSLPHFLPIFVLCIFAAKVIMFLKTFLVTLPRFNNSNMPIQY
jgi:hypothetical protein